MKLFVKNRESYGIRKIIATACVLFSSCTSTPENTEEVKLVEKYNLPQGVINDFLNLSGLRLGMKTALANFVKSSVPKVTVDPIQGLNVVFAVSVLESCHSRFLNRTYAKALKSVTPLEELEEINAFLKDPVVNTSIRIEMGEDPKQLLNYWKKREGDKVQKGVPLELSQKLIEVRKVETLFLSAFDSFIPPYYKQLIGEKNFENFLIKQRVEVTIEGEKAEIEGLAESYAIRSALGLYQQFPLSYVKKLSEKYESPVGKRFSNVFSKVVRGTLRQCSQKLADKILKFREKF